MSFTSNVSSGVVITGETISGGKQYISSGGSASNTTIRSAGEQHVSSGGTTVVTNISSGGSQYVEGTAIVTNISSGGSQYVGGSAVYTIIYSGGSQYVEGSVTSTTINSGGSQYVDGDASGTTINSGGSQTVEFYGIAATTVVNSGGVQTVSDLGSAISTVVNNNGSQLVSSGGTALFAAVSSGGVQKVFSSGIASSTVINSGGSQIVEGKAVNTTISSGGQQLISGGTATATAVYSDGRQFVTSGGTAGQTLVKSGGMLMIGSGGSATGFIVSSGGILGWDFNAVLSGSSGGTAVSSSTGGYSYNFYISSGCQYVSTGQTADNTSLTAGGIQYVMRGGTANSGSVNDSGWQYVSSGGMTNNTVINSGGFQDVSFHGTANDTVINTGGRLFVGSGGTANNIFIDNGGDLNVDSGGQITGTIKVDGGHAALGNAGAVSDMTSIEYVLAGTSAKDTLITVNDGTSGTELASYSIDLDNAVAGSYYLLESADLSNMAGENFTINYGGSNISLPVGSSYKFTNRNSISLSISDSAFDCLVAVVSGDFIAPSVPAGLTQKATGASAALDWADSTDNSSGVKQYNIEYSTDSQFAGATTVTSTDSNFNLALTGLTKLTTCYWRVQAEDNYGNQSAWSSSSSFAATPVDTAGNSWQTAADIAALDNWVGRDDAADVYKLTMTNAGTLTLGLTGLTGNADLSLLNSAGTVLKTSANAGTASEAITNVQLLAGTYYVKVAAGAGVNDANYTLNNTTSYYPADTAGNTWQTAADIAALDNWVGFGDAADVYKITLTSAGILTLGLTGLTGNADLSLLNSAGTVLKTSANTGTTSEAISNVSLLAGTYYVKVAAGTGVNAAAYTLSNNVQYYPADTAGNTWQTATDIAALDNWVGFGDAADVYKITLTSAGILTLGLTGLTGNADLSLLNSAGTVLKTSANTGTTNEAISNVSLLAGTYYVKVAAGTGVNAAAYTLSNNVQYYPADTAGNTWQTATDIAALDNWVGFGDAADVYKITMTGAGMLTLGLTGLTGNADLSLLNSAGTVLKTSANTGTTSEAITGAALLAGTYYVKVADGTNVNSATYTLTSTAKYCPVDTAANDYKTAQDISSLDNWVGFGDAADVYKITLTNAGILTLGLTGLTGNADLSLLSSTGTVLKTSANTGTTSEAISNVSLLAGTYYVKVAAGTGVNDASYTLSNTIQYYPVDAAANDYKTAQDISSLDNWVGFGDAADVYKITMTNAGVLTLGLTGLTGNADLSLLSSTGTVLKSSSNTGTTNEAINSVSLLAGTYYVKVADGANVNDAAYTLSNTVQYYPVDAAANDYKTAQDISSLDNWVGFGDAADVYKITLTNAGVLTLGLTGLTGNADLSLLSSTGTVLKTSANTGTTNEAINSVSLLAGTYYIKVAAGTNVNAASYTLNDTIQYYPVDAAANDYKTAQDISSLDNWVGFGDAADVYKITMTNTGMLTLGLTGLTGNADLSLLSSTGTVLKSSSNTGTTSEGINNVALQAGTYYVKIAAGTNVNAAAYTLTDTIKYCPADTAANDYKTALDISNLDNWVGFGDAADVYKITMTNAGTLTLGLTGLGGNADLSLLSSTGTVLKTSANTGTADEAISGVSLLAGTYYVKIAAGTGVNDASYTLTNTINYFAGDTYDKAGNTIAAAKVVDSPTQTGWVGFGDSDDYYRFDLTTAAQGTLRLYDLTGGNADLTLYDAKGTQLKKSANTGTLEDTITSTLAAGTYYARVTAVTGNIDYKLDFSKKDIVSGMLAS